jgi:hypothetical protein
VIPHMTVAQLIALLQSMPPNVEVRVHFESTLWRIDSVRHETEPADDDEVVVLDCDPRSTKAETGRRS